MHKHLSISDVRLCRASYADQQSGLIGWVSFVANESILHDGIALRISGQGRPYLSFPTRRDKKGHDHAYFRPLGDDARRTIERQVFEQLGLTETTP